MDKQAIFLPIRKDRKFLEGGLNMGRIKHMVMVIAFLRKRRAIAQVTCNFIVNSNVFTLKLTQVT
jgi:hypothetical protein